MLHDDGRRTAPKVPGINAQPLTISIGFTPNRVSRKQRHPAHDKRKCARSAKPIGGAADASRIGPSRWDGTKITWTRLRRVVAAYGGTIERRGNLATIVLDGEAVTVTID